jgi:hypothetical protein
MGLLLLQTCLKGMSMYRIVYSRLTSISYRWVVRDDTLRNQFKGVEESGSAISGNLVYP